MKYSKIILGLSLLALAAPGSLAQHRAAIKTSDYQFTTVKEIPVTPVKNQYRSGTCWCFSTLSFLESEAIKAKNIKDPAQYPDFSEMFVVRRAYYDRAIKYVRLNGKMGFSAGSDFGDVLAVTATYGLMDQKAYTGMNYGYDLPVQGELDAVLKGYVDAVVKNPNKKLTAVWPKGLDGILDAYMGDVPERFSVNGVLYSPESYRNAMHLDMDNYLGFTSYTHHPFYKAFAMEVEDNWRCTPSWNVPLDELVAIIDNAIESGYTVAWGGDVSEAGFTRDGLAILLDTEAKASAGSDQERWVGKAEDKPAEKTTAKEMEVTQAIRQQMYDEKTSTDDHGMHIYGIAKDQNGVKYYLVKNSWGVTGAYHGIWYMSENYVKAKTLNILVNKNAVPRKTLNRIGAK